MLGHLKGWRLSAGDEHTVFDGSSCKLASVPVGAMTGRTFAEGADQARLIAAAPELAECLQEAISEIIGRRIHGTSVRKWEAILAKATGAA